MGESPFLAGLEVMQNGRGVRVEFIKIDGLISHTICLVNADEKTPVLTSRINEPAQPCFTELHQQGETLFLTGANGPCHWSMSVVKGDMTFAQVANPTRETLKLLEQRFGLNAPSHANVGSLNQFLHFDIACRLKEPVSDLHNQYIAVDGFQSGRGIGACFAMNPFDVARGMVLVGGPMDKDVFLPEPSYSMDCISEREFRFSPTDTTIASFPTTMRWSYAVWVM